MHQYACVLVWVLTSLAPFTGWRSWACILMMARCVSDSCWECVIKLASH